MPHRATPCVGVVVHTPYRRAAGDDPPRIELSTERFECRCRRVSAWGLMATLSSCSGGHDDRAAAVLIAEVHEVNPAVRVVQIGPVSTRPW
jgi:hypothetical protein